MRECLGWITNCPNDQGCPQNWLELSVSEIPTRLTCHVCEREVELVLTQEEVEAHAAASDLAAFPVVPCTGHAEAPRLPAAPKGSDPARSNGAQGPAQPAPAASPAASFWVVTLQNGESVKIDKDTMIIGRSRSCDVVIQSAKVSRQHASLTRVDGVLYIEDLGSANGVWLEGEKITRAKVGAGDVFTISDETLHFELR